MILEPKKIKSVTAYTFSPSNYHEVMGLDAMNLVFFNVITVYYNKILFINNKLLQFSF